MTKVMTRGKQQVLFNYLPNRTFDFAGIAAIARISSVRGEPQVDLNTSVLMRRIAEEASAWQEDFRPVLRNSLLRQTDRFVFLDPKRADSELFPKVLWCQNHSCGHVINCANRETLPNLCPACHSGRLAQLRFVRIHRCGALHSLTPPPCRRCNSSAHIALETRNSERLSNFRWICRQCGNTIGLYGGVCNCNWPDPNLRNMDIEVHRAGRTYYAHTTVLLNIPPRRLDSFLSIREWPAIAAAKFLGMTEVAERDISEFGRSSQSDQTDQNVGLSASDLDDLMRRQASGEITPEEMVQQMQILRERRRLEAQANSPVGIVSTLIEQTGVQLPVWERAGQEMLESIMSIDSGDFTEANHSQLPQSMGIANMRLVSDYPIITATYGYSRAEYQPNQCWLNPFPAHAEHGGRFPIFIDKVQADAVLISLDPNRIILWLQRNNLNPRIPSGTNVNSAQRAYFVELFDGAQLRETLHRDQPELRMVFGLLHTLSHLSVRQAALFSGLDRTSLSEYLMPKALTFAVYCNHRFGATIGALTALFEQSLADWLNAIVQARRCVYDPVCRERTSNCHACTHLPETSCRFFNLNLSRAFLFGGYDQEFGNIQTGYFDPSIV